MNCTYLTRGPDFCWISRRAERLFASPKTSKGAKDGALAEAPELLGRIESEYELVIAELRLARDQLVHS